MTHDYRAPDLDAAGLPICHDCRERLLIAHPRLPWLCLDCVDGDDGYSQTYAQDYLRETGGM